MGFDIPEPYKWDESFKVFYDNLDAEHKGLFDGIFACSNNPGDGGALASLAQKVKDHFANEEGMMSGAGYDALTPHKQAHDKFVADLSGLKTPLSKANIDFAKEWLVNHIKGTDFKYKGKL